MKMLRLGRLGAAWSAAVFAVTAVALCASAGFARASTLYLSKTSDSLGINQYDQITASPTNGEQVLVSSNSSTNVASATTTGTTDQIQVQGLLAGSTNILICTTDMSQCGTVYVTVAGGSSSTLSFSNANPTVSAGQTTSIAATNATAATLTISSNSNSTAVNISTAAQNITITGVSYGSSTVVVCASGTSQCGTLYVTVGGGAGSGGSLSFSNSSPSVSVGQATTISVYGGSGSYYVSNNTNSAVATINLSGANLTINGSSVGTTNETICDSSGSAGCSTLYITVGNTGANSGVTFSNTYPNVPLNSSVVVTLYGPSGYQFYVSANTSPNVVSTSLSGTTLTLYGLQSGSTTITVCVSGVSQCGTLPVTVNGSGSSSAVTFSTANPTVSAGQTVSDAIYGASSYYISVNSSPTIVSSTISGSNLNMYGIASGTSSLTVCSLTNISQCGTVTATVNGISTSGGAVSFLTSSLPAATVGSSYSAQVGVTGGTPPYTYVTYSGILPAGLSLGSTGQISGVPSTVGTVSFSIRASDTYGNSAIENLTLAVQQATVPAPGSVYNPGSYHDGTLVNDGGTIYVIYKGSKTPFTSGSAFLGLGYSFSDVVAGSTSSLALSGSAVSSATAAHPAGSWIVSNGTVYFVHATGIIPVPSQSVFQSNNGQWSLVVPANSSDMVRTVLSVMQPNDSRVQ